MITVKQLEFSYKKAAGKAIKGIDFSINEGEIFGFLGPSGAGKTTTQRIIIGLLRGYSGSVEVFGRERRQWGKDYFEKVGVAFDFPNLYEKLTAYENLDLLGSYYRNNNNSKDELLDSVGLLPDRDKRVEKFSKGMKMRLNFIRSLMHDPELLFFDEPTSGLDPVNAKIIRNMILDFKRRGKTVFLTTHNMAEADYLCDRVAFIVDGEVPVIDSPGELKLKHGRRMVKVVYNGSDSLREEQFPLSGIGGNRHFLDILNSGEVRTMHTQEATLEDIFIKLTGRELL
jgi:fluoroquinolone transport system ATP-binding protein